MLTAVRSGLAACTCEGLAGLFGFCLPFAGNKSLRWLNGWRKCFHKAR